MTRGIRPARPGGGEDAGDTADSADGGAAVSAALPEPGESVLYTFESDSGEAPSYVKALGNLAHDWVQALSSRPNRAPRRMLFVGPFALARIAEKQAKAWRDQLSADLGERFEVLVAEPPFDVDTDIEAKGYWLRPVARAEGFASGCSASRC